MRVRSSRTNLGKTEKKSLKVAIASVLSEFGGVGDVIGRHFEVKNSKGEVVYTIHQKPMAMSQLVWFQDALNLLSKAQEKAMKEKNK